MSDLTTQTKQVDDYMHKYSSMAQDVDPNTRFTRDETGWTIRFHMQPEQRVEVRVRTFGEDHISVTAVRKYPTAEEPRYRGAVCKNVDDLAKLLPCETPQAFDARWSVNENEFLMSMTESIDIAARNTATNRLSGAKNSPRSSVPAGRS